MSKGFYGLDNYHVPQQNTRFPVNSSSVYYGANKNVYENRYTDLSDEDILVVLRAFNTNVLESNISVPAVYSEQRTQSILPFKPNKYKVAVLGVYTDSTLIPLFNFANNIYTVTLSLLNVPDLSPAFVNISYTIQVDYVPYNVPDSTAVVQPIYLYSQMIIAINNAYRTAFNTIVAQFDSIYGAGAYASYSQVIGGITVTLPLVPPRFVNDNVSTLFYLQAPIQCNWDQYNSDPLNPTAGYPFMQISANYCVNSLFRLMPSVVPNPLVPSISGQDVFYRVYDTGNSWINYRNGDYYNMYEGNSSTDLWSNIQGLAVITSMPIRNTFFNTIASTQEGNGSTPSEGILLNFPYTVTSYSTESLQPISYEPQSEFIWNDILAQDSLSYLQYNIVAITKDGAFEAINIPPQSLASVKLLFRLK